MNPYEVLGVPPDATDDQIKQAYRKLARQHHPDLGGDTDASAAINKAYEILGDAEKRAHFDATGQAERPEDPVAMRARQILVDCIKANLETDGSLLAEVRKIFRAGFTELQMNQQKLRNRREKLIKRQGKFHTDAKHNLIAGVIDGEISNMTTALDKLDLEMQAANMAQGMLDGYRSDEDVYQDTYMQLMRSPIGMQSFILGS